MLLPFPGNSSLTVLFCDKSVKGRFSYLSKVHPFQVCLGPYTAVLTFRERSFRSGRFFSAVRGPNFVAFNVYAEPTTDGDYAKTVLLFRRRRTAISRDVLSCIFLPTLSPTMSSESPREYVIEHDDPVGPSEGLHDQRESGVAVSPSCGARIECRVNKEGPIHESIRQRRNTSQ